MYIRILSTCISTYFLICVFPNVKRFCQQWISYYIICFVNDFLLYRLAFEIKIILNLHNHKINLQLTVGSHLFLRVTSQLHVFFSVVNGVVSNSSHFLNCLPKSLPDFTFFLVFLEKIFSPLFTSLVFAWYCERILNLADKLLMDLRRASSPVYGRQWSRSSNGTESRSPSMSPAHRKQLGGVGGVSTVKRTQNVATKAAAQRLAKVMALQNKDNEEDDDEDHGFKFAAPSSIINDSSNLPAVSFARRNRSQSPAVKFRDLRILRNRPDLSWSGRAYSSIKLYMITRLSFWFSGFSRFRSLSLNSVFVFMIWLDRQKPNRASDFSAFFVYWKTIKVW